jgi:hypothetical protein
MLRFGGPELILLLLIVGALLMKDSHLRKAMLLVLLAAVSVIASGILPVSSVAVMTAVLLTLAALGVVDLQKRV